VRLDGDFLSKARADAACFARLPKAWPFSGQSIPLRRIRSVWEKTLSLEIETGQTIPTVFHWNDKGTIKPIHPKALYHRWKEACKRAGVPTRIAHDFRRTAVRNLERAGVPRSVAMKLTGHKTEAVYHRYAIVCEADLSEGLKKLAKLEETLREKMQPCGTVTDFSHSLATIPKTNVHITRENMAEGARFELADPLRGLQFSRLARSAAPSPLHITRHPPRSQYEYPWRRENTLEYLILF
jgi:hypothetical protein